MSSYIFLLAHPSYIYLHGALVGVNNTFYFGDCTSCWGVERAIFIIDADFALYNTSIICQSRHPIQFECSHFLSPQFVIISDVCSDWTTTNCIVLNASGLHTEVVGEWMHQITNVLDEVNTTYNDECNNKSTNMVMDIGYPLYGELQIVNSDYGLLYADGLTTPQTK